MIDPVSDAIREAERGQAETAYRLQLGREMYAAGHSAGFDAGYQRACADMDARWNQIARPVVSGISYAELEERRYGPGGREHVADPQPGDYTGGPVPHPEIEQEPELGLEAG